MNRWTGIGNLGGNPETKKFQDGGQVSNFSLATSRRYKNKQGEQVEQTEWHNLSAYGKLSEIVSKYFHKGMKVFVEGRLQNRTWEDEQGNKRYATDIVLTNFEFIESKKESDAQKPKKELTKKELRRQTEEWLRRNEEKDDLPF